MLRTLFILIGQKLTVIHLLNLVYLWQEIIFICLLLAFLLLMAPFQSFYSNLQLPIIILFHSNVLSRMEFLSITLLPERY